MIIFITFSALTLFVWLGEQKGIQPIKTYASKFIRMVVNVIGYGYGIAQSTQPAYFKKQGLMSFGLSCKDSQDNNDWTLRLTGATDSPDFPVKWPLIRCIYVCDCVCVTRKRQKIHITALKVWSSNDDSDQSIEVCNVHCSKSCVLHIYIVMYGLPTKSRNPICLLYTILLQYTELTSLYSQWLDSIYVENQFHVLQILMPVKYPPGRLIYIFIILITHMHTPSLYCLYDFKSLHVWYNRCTCITAIATLLSCVYYWVVR